MGVKRNIRLEEKELILFFLKKLNLNPANYPINGEVDEYESGIMGSIGLGKGDAEYAGDLIQVEYIDSDNTPVVITLTHDTNGQLLDLDFWKTDFSKLIQYPSPNKIIFR